MDIDKYINHLKKNEYSESTINTYKSVLNIYKPTFHNIIALRRKLKLYEASPNTIWTHYNVICSYMKWSKDKRLESLKELKLPKIPIKYMDVFTKEFLIKRTKVSPSDSSKTINKKITIRFLFETGLRASELSQIIRINKKTILVRGKGNKQREIFHNYETSILMNKFNFTTKTLRIWVKEVLGDKYTPHSIRRSHATHLLLKGANPKMVMMQLGHEKIETTFRYLNLSLEENIKIYNKFF